MKRHIFALLVMVALPLAALAQEETKKQYIPEKGDWALGFDAVPVLNFIGNTFNNTEDNEISPLGGTPSISGYLIPDFSIMGKYMLTDELALRANIGLMLSSNKYRGYVTDQKELMQNPLSEAKVIDVQTVNNTGLSLLAGAEYRKGKKRVQGVFGAGLLLAVTKQTVKYTYGNGMSDINQSPETYFGEYTSNGYRVLSYNDEGLNITAGLVGTAGIEWFVAPKIALGAEMNLSLRYKFGTQTYVKSEGYNPSLNQVEVRTDLNSPGNRGFRFGTESLGGSLYLMFYF